MTVPAFDLNKSIVQLLKLKFPGRKFHNPHLRSRRAAMRHLFELGLSPDDVADACAVTTQGARNAYSQWKHALKAAHALAFGEQQDAPSGKGKGKRDDDTDDAGSRKLYEKRWHKRLDAAGVPADDDLAFRVAWALDTLSLDDQAEGVS